MPKLKTHSGAKKRFNLTKSGKVKRAHAFKSHILTKKDTKRCRRLRSEAYADATNEATIKKMIEQATAEQLEQTMIYLSKRTSKPLDMFQTVLELFYLAAKDNTKSA